MIRQIILLSKVQICNLFGLNELKHTKDKKKKSRAAGLMVAWIFLLAMIIFYLSMMSYGLVKIGIGEMVPVLMYVMTSVLILCFTFLKASSTIFQMNSYELTVSFPVSGTAIVVSRFFTMYLTNLIMSILVMLPGTIIYGISEKPGLVFYVVVLIGTIFLPLIPITLATAIGAGITAISARMRHKSIIASLLSLILAIGVIAGTAVLPTDESQVNVEAIKDLTAVFLEQIKHFYMPAYWFGDASIHGNIGSLLLVILVSVVIFVVMVAILQRSFISICSALNATSAKNNYKMQQLQTNSVVKALWMKELKRYFASTIYVTNTMIGYLLMAAFGISLLFVSSEQLEAILGVPHIITKLFPLALGIVGNLMPTTAAAISMEGKQWWISQTLPIRMKDLILSKILVNLTIATPFYLIGTITGCIALRPGIAEAIWIFVVPAVYTVFCSVIGITVNLALPVLKWDNETSVVKQSASSMLCMLICIVCLLPSIVLLLVLTSGYSNLILAGTVFVLTVVMVVLYRRNNTLKIINIGQ